MPDNNPLRLLCKRCEFVSSPAQAMVGHDCPNCGHNEFITYRDQYCCDFCSDTNVTVAYPCRSFAVPMPAGARPATSNGWWAACPDCNRLIEAGDRVTLAERSADIFIGKATGFVPPRPILVQSIRDMHDQFWANREGPPVEALNPKGTA